MPYLVKGHAEQLFRTFGIDQETAKLHDPNSLIELNWPALFVDNPALDLINHYKLTDDFRLSFAMVKDLLSKSSGLRKEIEAIKLTSDEQVNKNLLKLTLVFYENGLLEKNRQLLNDYEFIKKFGGFFWDERQIKLIPFFIQKKYSDDLIRLILSEPAYFAAVDRLLKLDPALTQDVSQDFNDPNKLEELKLIDTMSHEESKILSLVFWVKGSLSLDGYQEIIEATEKYPLLASTLIALYQTKTINIDDLRQLALDPMRHLQKSITHHFAKELETFYLVKEYLRKLDLQELEAANTALFLLKKSNVTDPKAYSLILGKDKKGQALRILLPQLAKVENEAQRRELITILYAGVKHGIQTQGNAVGAIKDPEQLALAKKLRERFICVRQMQDLQFENKFIELAAQDGEQAKRFRQVILCVEARCKSVYEHLSGSVSYRDMLLKWNKEEENYRKTLYGIAYNGLMNSSTDSWLKLKAAENKILNIVDPKIESNMHHLLIAIANIIISVLTLTVANEIKYRTTGNYWFFTQTRSGEELRALDREVLELIGAQSDEVTEDKSEAFHCTSCYA